MSQEGAQHMQENAQEDDPQEPTHVNLPIFSANDQQDDEEEEEEEPQRRRVTEAWNLDQQFDSMAEMLEYVKEMKVWKKKQSHVFTLVGSKTFYYCNVVSQKRGMENCPAKLYTLDSNVEIKYSVYRNEFDHVHDKDGQENPNQCVWI